MEYASNAKGNLGVTLGAIGTGLGALGNGLGLFNTMAPSTSSVVSRSEFDMQQNYEKQLSDQALKIASLEAEKISDAKDVEVYKTLRGEIAKATDRIHDRIDNLEGIVNAQAVYNATNTATIGCIQNQVAQLQGMTKLVIPNSSVCPGWDTTTTPTT